MPNEVLNLIFSFCGLKPQKLHDERGISEERIISYHFDSMEYEDMTAKQMYVDLYVTGSNSRMMSSEIATYLTGRYVAFRIYTLSFVSILCSGKRTLH